MKRYHFRICNHLISNIKYVKRGPRVHAPNEGIVECKHVHTACTFIMGYHINLQNDGCLYSNGARVFMLNVVLEKHLEEYNWGYRSSD